MARLHAGAALAPVFAAALAATGCGGSSDPLFGGGATATVYFYNQLTNFGLGSNDPDSASLCRETSRSRS